MTIYFARRLEIRVPRSRTSFFCFLFLTFSLHICDYSGDLMLRAFVYVRTGMVKKRSQLSSAPLNRHQQLAVTSLPCFSTFMS